MLDASVALIGASNSYFRNFRPSNTRKLRSAIRKVRAGTGNCRVLFVGESNIVGCGAGTGTNNLVACRTNSASYQLAALMNSILIPASEDSWFGINAAGQSPTTTFTGDSRVVVGANWTVAVDSLGGAFAQSDTTATNPLTYTPLGNVDTFKLWYITGTNKGTANITIDGGAPASGGSSVNMHVASGGGSLLSATFTASSVGSHAFAVTPAATGANTAVVVIGIEAWDSTKSKVLFTNAGASGHTVSSLIATGQTYSTLPVAQAFAPDVVVIWEAQNDWFAIQGATETAATYNTQMQTLITAMLPTSDVILASIGPIQNTTISDANQSAARAAIQGLAQSNDLPLIDPGALLVNYPTALANGLMFSGVHENGVGYSKLSALLFNAMRQSVLAA